MNNALNKGKITQEDYNTAKGKQQQRQTKKNIPSNITLRKNTNTEGLGNNIRGLFDNTSLKQPDANANTP